MDRRRALAVAATTALTLSAGSLAFAANLGLLAHAQDEPVGKLNARNVAELLDPGKGTKTPSSPAAPASPDAVAADPAATVDAPASPPATAAVAVEPAPDSTIPGAPAAPAVVAAGSEREGPTAERGRHDDGAPPAEVDRPAAGGPATTAPAPAPTTTVFERPEETYDTTTTTPEATIPSVTTTERHETEHDDGTEPQEIEHDD